MAREAKRSNTELFKYGICINDECPKCKSKEIQKFPMRKELVCECGKELRECAPPKKSNRKNIYVGVATIAVVAIIGCIFAFSGGSNEEPQLVAADTVPAIEVATESDTVIKRDTVVVRDTIVQNNTVTTNERVTTKTVVSTTSPSQTRSANSGNGTISLSYGKYRGDLKNGYPDGMGRLTYSTNRVINKHDSKSRTASSGDYVIGEFVNGYFVQGKHYNANGDLIETLMIGTPPTSDYDSK